MNRTAAALASNVSPAAAAGAEKAVGPCAILPPRTSSGAARVLGLAMAMFLAGAAAMPTNARAQMQTQTQVQAQTQAQARNHPPAQTPTLAEAGPHARPASEAQARAASATPAQKTAEGFAAIPPLSAHVIDRTGLLNETQRNTLDYVLKDYETRTGGQIAVLLVDSTAPEAIEQYSIRVADAWKLGRKGIDDGVILVVARNNPASLQRLRIEAGRGVQGSLTDAQSKRILQDTIAPHFRQNDFYGGLAAGISAITALLDHENLPAPATAQQAPADDAGPGWMAMLLILLVAVMVVGSLLSRRRGSRRVLDDNAWGRAAGVIVGSGIGNSIARGNGGFGGGFSGGAGGGGFSGGGGGFDGGGASGNW